MLERSQQGRVAGRGLSSSRARFERRAAATRRRPRLLAAVAVGVLLLVGLAAWVGWFSGLLTVTTVEVRGVRGAAATQDVTEVAAVPVGAPVLRVDTAAVEQRLVAARRWSDVHVRRDLPHTLVVEVRPRVAVLAVRTAAGAVELVDRTGVAFRTVPAPPDGVPLVRSAGTTVRPAGVTAALQALGSLSGTLRRDVSDVTVGAADQVTFTVAGKKGRKTVVWGGAGAGETKARLVEILLGEPGTTIDVSVPSSPVTR